MTDDRGLSIFEETAEADEPTQVIPRVEAGAGPGRR